MLVKEQIKRILYLAAYAIYSKVRMFILPVMIVPVFVVALGAMAPKQYTNFASILIEESSLLNPFLEKLEFSFDLSNRMDALRTLVIGRQVLLDVALETGLVDESSPVMEKEEIHKRLAQSISLSLVGEELVRIHLKWDDPTKMKAILEAIVEKFIERLLAPTKTSLDSSEQFFLQQLEIMRIDLETAETKLAAFKKINRDVLPDVFSNNRSALDRLLEEKQEKLILLTGSKARLDTLMTKMGKANPILGSIEEKIIRAESDLSVLRTRYTDKHSKVVEKKREINNLKVRQTELLNQSKDLKIDDLEKLWQIANTLPTGNGNEPNLLVSQLMALEESKQMVAQLEQEYAILEKQVDLLSERLTSTSDIEKQLRQLERDHEVKTGLYKEMLTRYEMAKVTGQLVRYEGPDKVKTIERAYSPTQPINTPLVVTLILGIVLGIGSGVALVFVNTLLDSSLKDLKTIREIAGKPVVTLLPLISGATIDGKYTQANSSMEPRENL
ncbi:Polysaccharide biosynthesis chain length regulator SypO [Pseudoalteromonas luteoviolacea B = ATCC 29581]|nr:Polysaccharide biosynthesis chain length regulator SypO [Pseudoalteromonas luteoviolacea B = ATCC 29581]